MANLALATTLAGKEDEIFQDKLNHASLIDAAMLSPAKLWRYPHGSIKRLSELVTKSTARHKIIMTDAVFSMDGDQAPLKELVRVSEQTNAWLTIDDAHGFGVLGNTGAGSVENNGLDQVQVPVYMATLGKAMGVFGAFVAGSRTLIDALVQNARSYIFTTAIPPAVAAAIQASLEISQKEHWRREKLFHLVQLFKQKAEAAGLELLPSDTPIQPIMVGDNLKALQLSEALFNKGILLKAIRPPTVPQGTARLRVTLCAEHDETDINELVSCVHETVCKR